MSFLSRKKDCRILIVRDHMKSIIVSIIILFLGTDCMANLSEQILDTWIGISHQSITVITYNQDGTIFGTYQTPSINLKTTFDGNWSISNKVLQSHYIKSSPEIPFFSDSKYEDKVTIDGDRMFLEGIGSSDLEMVRVKYKEHWSVK